MRIKQCLVLASCFSVMACSQNQQNAPSSPWLMVDNFEQPLTGWTKADTDNQTKPYVPSPQITKIEREHTTKGLNHFLIKQPAEHGIVGNRKALSYKKLPKTVPVGETYTFFTRINVASFPNNHAFGLSNLAPAQINEHGYDAFEATLRVTDKTESNGLVNTGALMVKTHSGYSDIQNYALAQPAQPLNTNSWYNIWFVVNNASVKMQGQQYNVYVQGGEFKNQTLVYKNATFRMKRELPLTYFLANCNTGPLKKPYGNGGLRYDDIYMVKGVNLTNPVR
ncbi:hypothetical protein PESP_a2126 [Pseudoalteromonas espejiana DSM 9414]|uniref:Alginate lyase 2 domain-containing protein n=1 Tax=Pseudoalteromonas espejiana TaxID=28107 RepID=A0A510Y029_9GAMM|nr:hypothetical protein [Pseudoalteromonas espejiana]ASM50140.1 hypothetical protein PESP_a2126 [Pseudoalteromonas espejiana DSM 9414]GEK56640.1 hypothetical protein PES01_34850 [Pseudoalteromonas espejiana]